MLILLLIIIGLFGFIALAAFILNKAASKIIEEEPEFTFICSACKSIDKFLDVYVEEDKCSYRICTVCTHQVKLNNN